MQKTIGETEAYCAQMRASLQGLPACDLVIFPPFMSLPLAVRALEGTGVAVGAQDLYWEKKGAYTGEISGGMIVDAGGKYVIVLHRSHTYALSEPFELTGAEPTKEVEVHYTKGVTVQGQVLKPNGEPAAGLQFRFNYSFSSYGFVGTINQLSFETTL